MVSRFGAASLPPWLSLDAVERGATAVLKDIASLLPARWRDNLAPRRKVVLLDMLPDEPAIDATLPDGRQTRLEIADDASELEKAAKRHSVVLRVQDAEILSTVMRLPRRAMSRLDEVVTTNVAVWTPFAADDLHFKARASGAQSTTVYDDRQPTCEIELRCVPKAALADRFSRLADRSIHVDELWLGSDRSFACDLGSKKTRAARRGKRVVGALVGLAMIQVCVLLVVYRVHQDDQIEMLDSNLERIRQIIHARAAQIQRDKDTAKILAAIEERATGQKSMTFALKRLAAVLPAGAWYRELNVSSAGTGSLTIVSGDRIDPVSLVAATALLTVTEVNDLNGSQDAEHIYGVAFKTIQPADPD